MEFEEIKNKAATFFKKEYPKTWRNKYYLFIGQLYCIMEKDGKVEL